MIRKALALSVALLSTSCTVPRVEQAPELTPTALPEGAAVAEIEFGPVVSRVTLADTSTNIQYGWLCQPTQPRRPSLDRLPFSTADLGRGLSAVLEPLRYRIKKPSTSVFEPPRSADLVLGGLVTKLHSSICFPFSGSLALDRGDSTLAKGSVFVEVKWELYSMSEHRVVFEATTQGRFETPNSLEGGIGTIALNAFMASLRNAAALDGFRKAALALPTQPVPKQVQPAG